MSTKKRSDIFFWGAAFCTLKEAKEKFLAIITFFLNTSTSYSTMGAMSSSERGSFPVSTFEWNSLNHGFSESWWARALREYSFITLAVTVDQKEKKSNTCQDSNPLLRRENSHPKSNALPIKLPRRGQLNNAKWLFYLFWFNWLRDSPWTRHCVNSFR